MRNAHLASWPRGRPFEISQLAGSVFDNLHASAGRYPDRPAIIYYGEVVTYSRLLREVESLAAYLSGKAGVARGDRVLLCMQNSPQFVVAFYAILRAGGVIVPINPMSRDSEIRYIRDDSEAAVALCGGEMAAYLEPLLGAGGLSTLIVAEYRDYAPEEPPFELPASVAERHDPPGGEGCVRWADALEADAAALPAPPAASDWCIIAYSSGTTGHPKGCLHTHSSVNATINSYANWLPCAPASRFLAALPFFHATGMQNAMNLPIFLGGTIVLMTRWDRRVATQLIERYRVGQWRSITTMMIDFLSQPDLDARSLESLACIGGGGAAMPAVLAERLRKLTGLHYIEAYGLTETMAATHINPPDRPKPQCLGVPGFGVVSGVIDPETLRECEAGEVGEIVISTAQLFQGYWRKPEATAEAFLTIEGRRFLRTGDLGYVDEEGYFFLVDRVKRMISVSGFKVWPAELEALLHEHEDVQEVCVVGVPDPRRGEAVKAIIVPRAGAAALDGLGDWCRGRMAAYKVPSIFEYVQALPRSASGKVEWRRLQDEAAAAPPGENV